MNETHSFPSDWTPDSVREGVTACRDILLANLVMMAETPAPTFEEEARVRFLLDRFREAGLDHISDDEMNNGIGLLPGPEGTPTLAITAHLDTIFDSSVSHALSLGANRVRGIGIGDNSLGAAVLASIPHILEAMVIRLNMNVLFLGVSRSLGKGNLGGIRFLLEHSQQKIDQAICLEGAPFGRLNFTSLAMMRGEIRVEVPDEYDFSRFGVNGAIVHINDVMNRMLEIPRPSRPQTSVVFGSLLGGTTFHELARKATLRFEVRSEADDVVDMIEERIGMIIEEVSARSGVDLFFDKIAFRRQGGVGYEHPLVQTCREVMDDLNITPKIGPSMSELAAFIAKDIPAVTLGLTRGHMVNTFEEEVEIEPLFDGIAQVIGILLKLSEQVGERT